MSEVSESIFMAVEVQVEFPVVTRTTPSRGDSKIIMGTVTLPVTFRELDPLSTPIVATVGGRSSIGIFRCDQEGQFYWQVASRLQPDYEASFDEAYFLRPGIVNRSDVEPWFERTDRDELNSLFNKRDFGKPRRIDERKTGSYDQSLVDRQIEAQTEHLSRYVVIGTDLYLATDEPMLRVSKFGIVYFQHGDPWQTLYPLHCFSLLEIPRAQEAARRLSGKNENRIPEIEVVLPERLSSTFADRRFALVHRCVLGVMKEYIAESNPDEIGLILAACATSGHMMSAVATAAQEIQAGLVSPAVLEAAELILDPPMPSPFDTAIDVTGKARLVVEFLREEWNDRSIDLGSLMSPVMPHP